MKAYIIWLWLFLIGYGVAAFFATQVEAGGLGGLSGGLGSGQRWEVVDPYDPVDTKTVTRDRRGNYTVTDPYDATYRREIRRTLRGGYVETDPFDATYRREWRRQ